jgi:hypothetical protein
MERILLNVVAVATTQLFCGEAMKIYLVMLLFGTLLTAIRAPSALKIWNRQAPSQEAPASIAQTT